MGGRGGGAGTAHRSLAHPEGAGWNDTFNISYQRFRHRVEQIAQLNHSRVEGAVVSEWDEIPDGALVMPVDDDDWFVPGAAQALEAELDPEAIGYLAQPLDRGPDQPRPPAVPAAPAPVAAHRAQVDLLDQQLRDGEGPGGEGGPRQPHRGEPLVRGPGGPEGPDREAGRRRLGVANRTLASRRP